MSMLALQLGLMTQMRGGTAAWTPAALFASSEEGAWYDPSDLSTLSQTSTGTLGNVSVGDPVGYMADKSGNGKHATQATAAARPILRQTAGGLYYLEFDGVDDGFIVTIKDFSTSNHTFLFATNYTLTSDPTLPRILHVSDAIDGLRPISSTQIRHEYGLNYNSSTVGEGENGVIGNRINPTTPQTDILENWAVSATRAGYNGGGNDKVTFFVRPDGVAGTQVEGRFYGFILVETWLDGANLDNAFSYLAAKSGVTL